MNVFRRVNSIYTNLLNKNPYVSQAVQVSVLMGAGDIIAQHYVEKKPLKEINKTRTLQFCGLGFFLVGPCLRVWYGTLDKIFLGETVKWKQAVKKVAVDQIIFAPVFLGVITTSMSIIQGLNLEQIKKRFENEYIDIMLTNYKVWPATQLINFTFMPLNFQVLFAQIIAILWNTYLSTKLKKKDSIL